ncbi:nucleotidyl transferase AbiEii/AbiGii toxin family protein [Sandaracinomonas limnophila]|nr:nucleotidyl transferase AbiEii/AbiGii toxin family protein [Sandaracinomonas limnophila]
MNSAIFKPFRLVGGTALSLQIGHRESVDIDLFSDQEYKSINFEEIDNFLKQNFKYVSTNQLPPALGKAYIIGADEKNTIKLDIYYTEPISYPCVEIENIRMASCTNPYLLLTQFMG